MGNRIVLRGGTLVDSRGAFAADVLVENEKIAGILGPGTIIADAEAVDVNGKHILPGVIDVHVHAREPGMAELEDFGSASRAAAVGGITTVLDMPNTVPPVSTAKLLQEKQMLVNRKAHVDYGLYAAVTNENVHEIRRLAQAGAIAFKIFLGETTGDLPCPGPGQLLEAFRLIADTGLVAAVHAEDRQMIAYRRARLQEQGRTDYAALNEANTPLSEALSIQYATMLAAEAGTKLYVVHMSTRYGVKIVRRAKADGISVTAETCPHYLLLRMDDYKKYGNMMKVYPPVRTDEDIMALYEGLADGTVDAISSDHAPHPMDKKRSEDIWKVPGGMVMLDYMVPILLDLVNRGHLSLMQLVRCISERPAQIFGLYPRKGNLGIGADADLTIVDMSASWTINPQRFQSKSRNTVFGGLSGKGSVWMTISNGRIVAQCGEVIGAPQGRWIHP